MTRSAIRGEGGKAKSKLDLGGRRKLSCASSLSLQRKMVGLSDDEVVSEMRKMVSSAGAAREQPQSGERRN